MEQLSLDSCGVTSLQPLRGLSSMKHLSLCECDFISSLGGQSEDEYLRHLQSLEVIHCKGVTSLRPLSQLGEGLQTLQISLCHRVQEEVLELPHVQPTAHVVVEHANVKEVVLAGG
jgi:hypothetical protein